MADIKSAQLFLHDLPKNDALKALHELTRWIESVREHQDFRLDQQLEVLRLLDETARPYERKLTRDYFADKSLTRFHENRLWVALNDFFLQIAQAYLNVQVRYSKGDKGSVAIQSSLPLIAARCISALAGRLKCAAARYALPDQTIWGSLAELYSYAEVQKYLDQPVTLYAGLGVSTSVRYEFASLLMWYASGASTLKPLQVHLAERLTSHFCRSFAISVQKEPGSVFCFDLEHPAPPMRLNADPQLQPGMRFLGAGAVQPHIQALLGIVKKGVVPETINLGGVFDADAVREVVRHLSVFWGSDLPTRRAARHKVLVKLHVAIGFFGVLEKAGADLDPATDTSEQWTVEDISISGMRCVLPSARVSDAAIGSLIGTRPERGGHWGAGIVRRLIRDKQNNLHVGIELLGNHVSGVSVREHGVSGEQRAVLLNNANDDSGEVTLLMNAAAFSENSSLHVKLSDKNYLLMPLALLEKGVDYDLARYRMIEEDVGAEETH